ncbi:hypothetical protein GCM10023187_33290 [Nibrella viscosa]|uniref:CBM6 domain-containing protein n=1 Tax=Nibrella viscosa TaxID=1084524 RepID=A0ABP8KLW5_9BACT
MNVLLPAVFFLWSIAGLSYSVAQKTLPGKLEAESYDAMYGVQTENTSDAGGGQNVGWIDAGDWMDYQVVVPATGNYTFRFRVANSYGDGKIEVRNAGGVALGQLPVPRTGGWQSWVTISAIIPLTAGAQTIRIYAVQGDWNFNWFEVSSARPLPGKLEAESYDAMSGIQTEATTDAGGGLNVGWIDAGDWLDYNVIIASTGSYQLNLRVANSYGNGVVEIRTATGAVLGQASIPQTGGWQSWTTLSIPVTITAGSQVLRVYAVQGDWNFNWLELVPVKSIPGKIEAENYDAMSGVQTENTADAGGGQNVGWIDDGDWMDYNVSVASAGNYTFKFRVANSYGNGKIQIRNAGGSILGQVSVPQTGGWQNWTIISTIVPLPAGSQVLRIYAEQGAWNFNYFEAFAAKPIPAKLEAEDYDAMFGIQTETTSDAGGGLNVGRIDANDWLDFNVRTTTAGTYTVNFRVANAYGNGIIQLRAANGAVLGQVSVPQTGGWQSWTTLSMVVSLPAGDQVLRVFAVNGDWNFNWLEVIGGGTPPPSQTQSVITFGDLPAKTVGDPAFDLVATSNNTATPISFTSSNPAVVSVSNSTGSWKATVVGAGPATITASQAGNAQFITAEAVSRSLTVQAAPINNPPVVSFGVKIPIDPKRWYQLNNVSNGLDGLFDGQTNVRVETGWGKILSNFDAYYPLLDGEEMTIEGIKFYDGEGSMQDAPMTVSVITNQWQRIPIATFTGQEYNTWVGPYPNRPTTGDARFKLDTPISGVRYLVINAYWGYPNEMEIYGSYTPSSQTPTPAPAKAIKLKNMFGINAFEWDFEDGQNPTVINETKLQAVKTFTGIRHYMDWEKLESQQGKYTYNPVHSGGWNYDIIYERCKAEGIEVLADLKTIPHWMQLTYPEAERDAENVPVRYGKDYSDPNSYIEQAKVAFQYIARYGHNPAVNPALLSVNSAQRWTGDGVNTVKIGLGLISYIECDNERDKWWKGRKAYQTAREYAANLSAFYDGHKNTMGPGVGVKNADPSVKVVMGGLASAYAGADYLKGMIDWCKEFRGYRPDGRINLCWDVINYHLYTDDANSSQSGTSTRGVAPEGSSAGRIAKEFIDVAHALAGDMPVWITETGYDVNQGSPIKAIPIGNKSALQTQADWILRTALFYARLGIEKVFLYQLYDDNFLSPIQFGSSGLMNPNHTRKPAADYIYQVNQLLGEYTYRQTLHADPIVDRYESGGKSAYILVVPDETGRTAQYTLDLGTATQAKIYTPKAGSNTMEVQEVNTVQGKLTLTVTETPVFVIASNQTPNGGRTAVAAVTESQATENATTPLEQLIRVYPNPTTDYVLIDIPADRAEAFELSLFDAGLGKQYRHLTIHPTGSKSTYKLDVSALQEGMYLLEIRNGSERVIRKVLKSR